MAGNIRGAGTARQARAALAAGAGLGAVVVAVALAVAFSSDPSSPSSSSKADRPAVSAAAPVNGLVKHWGTFFGGAKGVNYDTSLEPVPVTLPGPIAQIATSTGTDIATYTRDRPGLSAFVLEDGTVYHTYSCYARGVDGIWGMYQWLDRAPKGRNEHGIWWRRHDEYAQG